MRSIICVLYFYGRHIPASTGSVEFLRPGVRPALSLKHNTDCGPIARKTRPVIRRNLLIFRDFPVESIALTVLRRTRDNALLMAMRKFDFASAIESRFPGLLEEVRKVIQESERAYEGNGSRNESFLWEHTLQVASIACRLAEDQGIDPLIPVVAALFHDAGKFSGGAYHSDETIEEEESARIAEQILRRFGMNGSSIRKILAGLRALYNEKSGKNAVAAIIHDADFLSKFGALGIAGFFTKSALRGRTLRSAVLGYLSKELTYAACLPLNMHTAAGRKLASRKSAESLRFFRSLLAELRDTRMADLSIRRMKIPYPSSRNRFIEIHFVSSSACTECGGKWEMAWATEEGLKCRKLNIDWACIHCGKKIQTSFCLPEIK